MIGRSTEPGKYTPTQVKEEDHMLTVSYRHHPGDDRQSLLETTIKMWSNNQPFLLVRHTSHNISELPIEDLKVYYLNDFDLGGPDSYNDDFGVFNADNGKFTLWDESPVFVKVSSRPKVDAWDVAGPVRLRPSKFRRDLRNNSEIGPTDLATAQQWNLGDLQPGDQRTIDIVIAAGRTDEDSSRALAQAWDMYTKRIR